MDWARLLPDMDFLSQRKKRTFPKRFAGFLMVGFGAVRTLLFFLLLTTVSIIPSLNFHNTNLKIHKPHWALVSPRIIPAKTSVG